jgi:hypothetical protein
MGCETTILTSGREVLIVGFGRSEDGYGEKRVGVTEFGRITSDDEAFLGGGGIDACQGDSGGPVYVRLATADGGDDTWRVFGITSYGDPDCLSGGYYSMMHIGMEWFEEESGFDLTPCHDADGTWRPGPSCRGFPKDPGSTHGTWSNGCAGGPQGNWSSVCGAAFDPSNDKDAPSIAFVTPRTDVRLESDPSSGLATTTIELEANDGDGYGIQAVELLIDGKSIPSGSLEHEPYSYSISFPRGVFSIQATAVDFSANMAQTELILIGVDMDPVPSGDSDTDAGSTGSETTSDFGTTDSGASSSSSAGSAASEAAPSGKGCGCRTGTRSTPFWGLLMLCFGLRGRRAIRMIPRVSR